MVQTLPRGEGRRVLVDQRVVAFSGLGARAEIAEAADLRVLPALEHRPRIAELARADDDRLEVVDLVGERDGLRLPRLVREVLEVGALPLLPRERLVLLAHVAHEIGDVAPNFSVERVVRDPAVLDHVVKRARGDDGLREPMTREDRGHARDVTHVRDGHARVLPRLVLVPDRCPVERALQERGPSHAFRNTSDVADARLAAARRARSRHRGRGGCGASRARARRRPRCSRSSAGWRAAARSSRRARLRPRPSRGCGPSRARPRTRKKTAHQKGRREKRCVRSGHGGEGQGTRTDVHS